MTSSHELYAKKVEEVYSRITLPLHFSPASLLDAWDDFTAMCEDGYGFGLDEYEYDLNVRDKIEALITAPELQGFEELAEFHNSVDAIDRRFKMCLEKVPVGLVRSNNWWQQGVLKSASKEYVEDVKNRYGIVINESS